MAKVSLEIATEEVTKWLDKKKVYTSTRELYKDSVDTLIEAMVEGDLSLDTETFVFTHKLLMPLEGELSITEFKYKHRMNDNMLKPHLNGVKPSDADGRLTALIAALTDQPKNIISKLDSADKKICTSIAIFFL
jgi:hypothetical protein